MPNKTPSYKDKVIAIFSNKFGLNGLHAKPVEYANYEDITDEVETFISQSLEEQMKLVMECLPDTDYVMMLKVYQDKFKKNLRSKGLI